jgi:hypothetical protein
VHVGEDQRVVDDRAHTFLIASRCYRVMKLALKVGQGNHVVTRHSYWRNVPRRTLSLFREIET